MQKLFIVNPSALRDRTQSLVNKMRSAFGENISVKMTEKGGDAESFAGTEDADEVYAVGGDGTVCEVANGLGKRILAGKKPPVFAVIPAGSGNDFARSEYGAELTAETAIKGICSGKYSQKPFDMGKVDLNGGSDTKFFVNIASVGFDAEIVKNAERYKKNPLTRRFSYILSIFYTIFKFKGVDVEIECNGEVTSQKMLLVAVANGSYYGGGVKIAPDADLHDGVFDIVSAPMLNPFRTLCLLPRLLNGSHVNVDVVTVRRSTKIRLNGKGEKLMLNLDGEILTADSADFDLLPSVMALYCKDRK